MIGLARFAATRIGVSAILARAVCAPAMLPVNNSNDDAKVVIRSLFIRILEVFREVAQEIVRSARLTHCRRYCRAGCSQPLDQVRMGTSVPPRPPSASVVSEPRQ